MRGCLVLGELDRNQRLLERFRKTRYFGNIQADADAG